MNVALYIRRSTNERLQADSLKVQEQVLRAYAREHGMEIVETFTDSASGTSTKTLSKGFGELAAEGDGAQIELRASWSPTGSLAPHAEAWAELVGMLAGLPPGSEDIAVFGARRTIRD